jgi:hypothetical protein
MEANDDSQIELQGVFIAWSDRIARGGRWLQA